MATSTRTTRAATASRQQPAPVPKWMRTPESLRKKWLAAVAKNDYPYDFFKSLNWSPRLLRLFAVACCRHPLMDSLLDDPRSRTAVDVAEKFADGLCGQAVLRKAWNDAWAAREAKWNLWRTAATAAATTTAAATAATAATAAATAATARAQMRDYQGSILVAIIGPDLTFSPDWRTGTVRALAAQIYDSRDWSAMPILADALQDAGCDQEKLLAPMRDPETVWCRGAWVLDVLLGKRS